MHNTFINRLLEPDPITVHSVWKQDARGGHSELTAVFRTPSGYQIDAVDWCYRFEGSGGWRSELTAGPVLFLYGLPPKKRIRIVGNVVAAHEAR